MKFENYTDIAEVSNTPASPDAGHRRIYAKANGKMYQLTSGGLETEITNVTSGQGVFVIPMSVAAAAVATWTNMPLAVTFLFGSARHIVKADLTGFSQVRLIVNKQATAGAASSKLIVRYKPSTYSEIVGDYVGIGVTEVSVAINVTSSLRDSGWINLTAGAKADVNIAIVGSGGDGVLDPQFGNILIMFK